MQLDFEKSIPFNKIEVYTEFPMGTDWKTEDDGMKNKKIGSPITLEKKLRTRFVRIKMANSKDLPRPHIWEIKVF